MKNLPSLEQIDKELSERSLYSFIKSAWKTIEPKEFVGGWHIQAVCDHLEAVTRGQIRNLIINIPPRHTKSMTVSVLWPAWVWGPANKPGTRWLFTSYSSDLSIRDSVKCRTVLLSQWYQRCWGTRFRLLGDLNVKERYHNNAGGMRVASSVGGMATGEGGDVLVIDDPHNIRDIHSYNRRAAVAEWYDTVMSSRMNDPKSGARVLIMQRCHAMDLVGHIKEKMKNDGMHYEELVLPAEFEEKTRCVTSIGFSDPRKKEGELLWPARFGKDQIKEQKALLGRYAYDAQYQQRAGLVEGSIFKREWWKFYTEDPKVLAESMDYLIQSWDMSFKGTMTSDYVVGQVWGVRGPNRYLLDEIRERMTFVETQNKVRTLSLRWPKAVLKYVENKANGPAIVDSLKSTIAGFKEINPVGDKESRAYAVTPEIEAGCVFLPTEKHAPWIPEYLEELSIFNRGAYDDRVDCTSQALLAIRARGGSRVLAPIGNVVSTTGSQWDTSGTGHPEGSSPWNAGNVLEQGRLN